MNARARSLRQTMTTALQRQLRPRPSLFISATEYRNANRIVPSVARGGRNYDSRAWKRWWCCSSTGTIVLPRWNEEREGKGEEGPRGKREEKGKREEVNQFESPSSDPAARERSVSEIAPYSFGYSLIRYTERKARRSRTCVRTEWRQRAISRAGDFPGFPFGRMCTVSSVERSPFAKTNVRDKNTFSVCLGRRERNGRNWTQRIGRERIIVN